MFPATSVQMPSTKKYSFASRIFVQCTHQLSEWEYFYRQHPKDDGRLCFHRSVCMYVQLSEDTPSQVRMRGATPSQVQRGYPIPGLDREIPHPRSRWVVPHLRSGHEVPHPRSRWRGGTPSQVWTGVLHPRSRLGVPHLDQVPGQDGGTWAYTQSRIRWGGGTPGWMGYSLSRTRWCTPPPVGRQSYTAGGMPLAFTQEDFLVSCVYTLTIIVQHQEGTVISCTLLSHSGLPQIFLKVKIH